MVFVYLLEIYIMKEDVSYPELIRFAIDPLAPYVPTEGTKFQVCQAMGINLYTANNLQIMDFTAGMNGINLGHNHPKVLSAVANQMVKYARSAGNFNNSTTIHQLWEYFSSILGSSHGYVYLTNTEEKAVRYAIRLAYSITKRPAVLRIKFCNGKQQKKPKIESLIDDKNNGQDSNLDPSTYYVNCCISPNNISELTIETAISELLSCLRDLICSPTEPAQISAIIVNLVDKDNGFFFPPLVFLSALRCLCDRYGIIFIFDERATAFGRTGKMLASQDLDVYPDLTIVGKGIANGYSLGCVIIRQEIVQGFLEDVWNDVEVDPISCTAALTTLNVIYTEDLLKNCQEMGGRLLDGLQVLQIRYPFIEDIRGMGLNIALEFINMENNSSPPLSAAWDLACFSLQHGLLTYCVNSQSRFVCLMPPINVTKDHIDRAIYILEQGLNRIQNAPCWTKSLSSYLD